MASSDKIINFNSSNTSVIELINKHKDPKKILLPKTGRCQTLAVCLKAVEHVPDSIEYIHKPTFDVVCLAIANGLTNKKLIKNYASFNRDQREYIDLALD